MRIVQSGIVASLLWLAACSAGDPADELRCGPGTVQVGIECLPAPTVDAGVADSRPVEVIDARTDAGASDAGVADAAYDAQDDAGPADAMPRSDAGAPPDADPLGSEATNFAIDPAHDNAQPTDTVASPLKPAWKATFGGAVSYPLVVGGLVVVAAAEAQPNVRALDITTGNVVWGPKVFGAPVTLAYDSGLVFALDTDGHLSAMELATGTRSWSIQVPEQDVFESPPVALGGVVYVNGLGFGGTTVAIDAQTGAVLWEAGTFDGSGGCVAVGGGTVYEAEACDQLSAFDATTGTLDWFDAGGCTGGGGAAPAVHDGWIWDRDPVEGNVIVDSSGHSVGTFSSSVVPAFDGDTAFYTASSTVSAVGISTDDLHWSFTGDGQLCTSPAVAGAGHQVFVGSMSGNVYEINETTGKQVSVDDVGTAVTCSSETQAMSLAEGHLLVPAGNVLVVY